jgi:hypothetical protein
VAALLNFEAISYEERLEYGLEDCALSVKPSTTWDRSEESSSQE